MDPWVVNPNNLIVLNNGSAFIINNSYLSNYTIITTLI